MQDRQLVRDFANLVATADPRDDDVFRQTICAFRLVALEREFAHAFDVDDWTLRRWGEGHSVPLPALRPPIYRWLGERAERKLAALAEEDAVAASASAPVVAPSAQGLAG